MGSSITDFINNELYPLLFEKIDDAFPEMDFKKGKTGWISGKTMEGLSPSHPRQDKCIISYKKPTRIMEQGRADTYTLIDFQMRRTGENLHDALRSLCNVVGLELPSIDSEEYKAYRERQERLEVICSSMRKELFQPEGKEVLQYLTDIRGYSEERIKSMGLGFLSKEMEEELFKLRLVGYKDDRGEWHKGSMSKYNPLVIPYISGGHIKGFKFRAISPEAKVKYKNSNGLQKKLSLFGLTGINLSVDERKDITVVEGELDALHAQAEGITNVVAAAGGELSIEVLEEAKRKGVRRVTLLFDTEDSTQGQRRTEDKIRKALYMIHEAGLSGLVAVLPSEAGVKQDVDSYLKEHTKDELESIINEATSGALYLFGKLTEDVIEQQGGEGNDITAKLFDDYKKDVISLVNSPLTTPTERDIIFKQFSETTGSVISKETIQEEADMERAKKMAVQQREDTLQTIKTASTLASSGQIDEALELMGSSAQKLRSLKKEGSFEELLILPSADSVRRRIGSKPTGFKTGYEFGIYGKRTRLTLPTGALTFVCALPSHGKSTFLQNLALQAAMKADEGTVLYFTFEEDSDSVIAQFVNKFVGLPLSNENLESIRSYYKLGTDKYIKREYRDTFKQQESLFFSRLITNGKLRIFYKDYDTTELIDAIRYVNKHTRVKAVFIDYVQLLYKKGCTLQRREEIKEFCNDFKNLAVDIDIPIVMAAQLNREAKSPAEMHSQNIADSADVERIANTVVLLWNSKFKPLNKSEYDKHKTEFENMDFKVGEEGKMFAFISKNRGGISHLPAVWNYDGNTGIIERNFKEEKGQATQELLPF